VEAETRPGGRIAIRSFRGTRKSSVYRELLLPEATFVRLRAAAARHNLVLLASLEPGQRKLDELDAQTLAEQLTQLRSTAAVPDLDADLTAITQLARWCAHARKAAWLTITRQPSLA
jgi:hypothetical protein